MTADVALLRVSGLPGRLWLVAASAELFAAATELDAADDRLRAGATALAAWIGHELVLHPDLLVADRARALVARRGLHRTGHAPDLGALADLADRLLPASELVDALRRHDRRHRAAAAALRAFTAEVEAASLRVLGSAWPTVLGSAVARRAVQDADPAALADIAARVGRGEEWTNKRLRRRADHLWRMITRGSTRATPRGWLAHVALLPLVADAPHGPLPAVQGYATEWSDNLHRGATEADLADPDALVSLAPLHRELDGHTRLWVVRAEDPTRMHGLTVRTTPALDAIRRALRGGPLTLGQLSAAVLPGGAQLGTAALPGGAGLGATKAAPHEQQAVLAAFVAHLVELGVLTVCRRPDRIVHGWRSTADELAPTVDELPALTVGGPPVAAGGRYTDVYRRADGGLSVATATELARLVDLALRVLAAIDPDGVEEPPDDRIGPLRRPVLDALTEDPGGDGGQANGHANGRAHRHDWQPATVPGSPHARLLAWLSPRLDDGPVDLDLAPDTVSGPVTPALDWPVDCLVRPLWTDDDGPTVVLDRIEPTGILDARFADGLAALFDHGADRVAWYREFLREVEDAAGGRFVELLAPSLSEVAANAVRRPVYAGLWTGDPDLGRYCRAGPGGPPRYVPPADITVRSDAGRRFVEAGGERIWPVYHATRRLPPPWDAVGRWLLGTGPAPDRSRWRPLRYSLPAWPDRDHLPRITVGGGALVLTCAQWRLRQADLWPPDDPPASKVRAMDRLRRRLDLPRWVAIAGDRHDEPTACDLLSLRTIHTVDRIRRRWHGDLYVMELLPAPDRLPVTDLGADGTSQAELLLRLPLDTSPAVMAARAVAGHRARGSAASTMGSRGPTGSRANG